MESLDSLFSARAAGAFLVYGISSGALAFVIAWVDTRTDNTLFHWLWERLYAPMLRAGAVVLFLLLAYPALYGLEQAPGIGTLLAAPGARFGNLLASVYLLSLVLPLLAPMGLIQPIVLPLQGLAGSALLFHWLAAHAGLEAVSYWPGLGVVMVLVVGASLAFWLASRLVDAVGDYGRRVFGVTDLDAVLEQAVFMLIQAPVMFVYGLGLGAQLSTPTAV